MKFENVKAGDKLICCHGSYGNYIYEYVIVDRVTQTMIVIGDTRYSKKNGIKICGGAWLNANSLHQITDKTIKKVELSKHKELKKSYVSTLERTDWTKFELNQLKHIYSVVKEYNTNDSD